MSQRIGGAIFFRRHAEHNLVCAVIGVGPHGSPTSARAKSGGPLLKTPHLWQRPSLFLDPEHFSPPDDVGPQPLPRDTLPLLSAEDEDGIRAGWSQTRSAPAPPQWSGPRTRGFARKAGTILCPREVSSVQSRTCTVRSTGVMD